MAARRLFQFMLSFDYHLYIPQKHLRLDTRESYPTAASPHAGILTEQTRYHAESALLEDVRRESDL